jgi:hypothetical protein
VDVEFSLARAVGWGQGRRSCAPAPNGRSSSARGELPLGRPGGAPADTSLLDGESRLRRSTPLREAIPHDAQAVCRELALVAQHRPEALAAGRDLLKLLELEPVAVR